MTEETNKNGPDAAATEAEVSATTEGQVADEGDASAEQQPDPVETLKAENADLRDRFLRLAAHHTNIEELLIDVKGLGQRIALLPVADQIQHLATGVHHAILPHAIPDPAARRRSEAHAILAPPVL